MDFQIRSDFLVGLMVWVGSNIWHPLFYYYANIVKPSLGTEKISTINCKSTGSIVSSSLLDKSIHFKSSNFGNSSAIALGSSAIVVILKVNFFVIYMLLLSLIEDGTKYCFITIASSLLPATVPGKAIVFIIVLSLFLLSLILAASSFT